MLNITLSPEAAARFKELLAEEDNEDAVFRIREVKVGMACKSHMELRMGIDEREDEDEEQEVTVEGMPFVINNDVIDIYGSGTYFYLIPTPMYRQMNDDELRAAGVAPDLIRFSCGLESSEDLIEDIASALENI